MPWRSLEIFENIISTKVLTCVNTVIVPTYGEKNWKGGVPFDLG